MPYHSCRNVCCWEDGLKSCAVSDVWSRADIIAKLWARAWSSPIFKLCPRMFDGLLVVGGRLKHASTLSGIKNPIILPRDHHVSRMIVQEYHENTHLGVEWVLSRIRCKFWIVNARNMVIRVKCACVTCKRLYAAAMNQKMADLPPERCLPNVRPFSYTGLDFFGQFYVKIGRSQVKRYGCVFTCLAPEQFILKWPSVSILMHLSTHLSDLFPEEAPLRILVRQQDEYCRRSCWIKALLTVSESGQHCTSGQEAECGLDI